MVERLLSTLRIRAKRSPEAGVAMSEFAIVLPTLLFVVFTAVDLGLAIDRYMTLSRVVYEGVRQGVSLPGLEGGVHTTGGDMPSVTGGLHGRIQQVMTRNGMDPLSAVITTNLETVGSSQRLSVTVDFPFDRGLFGQLDGFTLSSEGMGPYLIRE